MRDTLGAGLLRWSRTWLDDATVANAIEPMVADAQRECWARNGLERARHALRWRAAFLVAFAQSVGRQIVLRRSWAPALSLAAPVLVFLGWGILLEYVAFWVSFPDVFRSQRLHLLLLPSLSSAAFPLSILPATIMLLTDHRWRPWEARMATSFGALLCVAVLIPTMGWIAPASNQAFRETTAHALGYDQVPLRGDRELTLPELLEHQPPADTWVPLARLRSELHNRAALLTAPLTLTLLGAALARRKVKRRVAYAIGAWFAAGAFWSLLVGSGARLITTALWILLPRHPDQIFETRLEVGHLVPWLPHLVVVVMTLLLHHQASRREVIATP